MKPVSYTHLDVYKRQGRYNKVKALQWTLTHSFYAKALAVKRVTSKDVYKRQELSCAIMVDSLAGYLEECNCKDIYTARAVRTPDYIFCGRNADGGIHTHAVKYNNRKRYEYVTTFL